MQLLSEEGMKNQIFISYRRDGGEALAQLLNDRLKSLGYEVFYDIESLKSGAFDTKLYEQIEKCKDFILVLPPQALDRCIYEEDWVRCEIRHALKHKKNIIPIMMRGFVFPKDLPDDIAAVSKQNGVEFETMEYLNARIEKIVSLLHSKPKNEPHQRERSDAPFIIRNICSLGSCDFNNTFPKDAFYSEVINRDKYNIIYFHLSVVPLPNNKEISSEFVIYDSQNNKVVDETLKFEWKPNYDTVVRSWVIRGTNGSFVKADTYRAEFRVENSAVYEYYFKVTANNEAQTKSNSVPDEKIAQQNKKSAKGMPTSIQKERSAPIGLLWSILYLAFYALTLKSLGAESEILPAICCAGLVTTFILLVRFTKRNVCNNLFLAILICSVFHVFYSVYLLIASIGLVFKSLNR